MKGISIEERATNLAHYIIDSKDSSKIKPKNIFN